ncbi:hypothetical protein C3B51_22745 [Pseudoalteromonas rubra]|uniref:TonB C-terminal domain-containing protein n=1 Tax=Pseudoalteromonas rubra TaxID=43658 RepID=A0A4Q7DYJ7_9GAMM|nr:hypothetical protein C3B51_22745 [Pseudoalteromonas rubra]
MITRVFWLFIINIMYVSCANANSVKVTFNECNNSMEIESQIIETIPSSSAFPNNKFQNADLVFQFRIEEDGRLHFFPEYSSMSHPYSREAVKLIKKNLQPITVERNCLKAFVRFDFGRDGNR